MNVDRRRRILGILDPTCSTRLWGVSYSGWHHGYIKNFWRKKSALKFAKTVLNYQFVTVYNNLTGEVIRVKIDERTPIIDYYTGEWLGFVETNEGEK